MSYRATRLLARHRTVIAGAISLGIIAAGAVAIGAPPSRPAYLAAFPNFAPAVKPPMPGDVDIALKDELEKAKQFSKVQREFDLNAWQMFLALNWPTNDQGRPAPRLEDTSFGPPHWTLWHNGSTIFQDGGAIPAACAQPVAMRQLVLTRDIARPVSRGLPAFRLEANAVANPRATRFLGVISAVGELNVANVGGDIQQAFTGPLIDQNGNFVFYEIMIDPNEVTYLCDHKLYNINGQVDFTKGGNKVDMPTGHPSQDWSGAFELKLAWKVLEPGKDDPGRFFVEDAYIMDQGPDGAPLQRKVKVGLVGMHIAHKSETSPQWIWATFEQVDNLDVDQVAHPNLRASFNSPDCPICTTDVEPQKNASGVYPRIPVQASRTLPIPADKVHLNAEVAAALGKSKSIWQYYQLIDTQWPTDPKSPPAAWDSGLAQAVANKPGGQPTPVFLTNITMETYFQGGNQPACHQEEGVPSSVTCPPVYSSLVPGTAIAAYKPDPVTWNATLNAGKAPVKPGISTQISATESCMGCHSSAGVWTSYDPQTKKGTKSGQLTADFSWLLSQKASWAAAP
ncbi:hypothetical protein SAMN05519103_07121 [Rhizobiales bacterium GAS113]|nr:hypothetical protein SAMN05519103_07121 [Rhizobiales bacterium GAS113]